MIDYNSYIICRVACLSSFHGTDTSVVSGTGRQPGPRIFSRLIFGTTFVEVGDRGDRDKLMFGIHR